MDVDYLSGGLSRDGRALSAKFEMATERPARVATIQLVLRVPPGLPTDRRARLRAVASHCTVHNTLTNPPAFQIDLA